MDTDLFFRKGWCRVDYDPILMSWVNEALPVARKMIHHPDNAKWLRCGGTWFAGVNVLPNDQTGAIADSGPLLGKAVDFIRSQLNIRHFTWDRGQISVCYPGYPRPMEGETAAAFRYRETNDAAHVDGLLPVGSRRRRHLREHHGFILGIPMVEFDAGCSPFVLWEGSHEIIRRTFSSCLENLPIDRWGHEDLTELYHLVRRRIFDECTRVCVNASPGEAFIVHRLMLHGVAPWKDLATASGDGRMICYFRPEYGGANFWLTAP